jgi:type VI protein secretion system component VasA
MRNTDANLTEDMFYNNFYSHHWNDKSKYWKHTGNESKTRERPTERRSKPFRKFVRAAWRRDRPHEERLSSRKCVKNHLMETAMKKIQELSLNMAGKSRSAKNLIKQTQEIAFGAKPRVKWCGVAQISANSGEVAL